MEHSRIGYGAAAGLIATAGLMLSSAAAADAPTVLYGAEAGNEELVTVHSTSAVGQVIGPFGNGDITGLAYDAASGILYGIHPGLDAIFTINPQTGAPTFLASANFGGNANGLAYVPGEGLLYGSDNNTNALFHLDPVTLDSGNVIMTGGFTEVEGLGYDPATDTLYGLADTQDQIVTINRTTGAMTALPNGLGIGTWRGLTFDTSSGKLYASRIGSVLTEIDPVTGIGTDVGTVSTIGFALQGLSGGPQPCLADLNGDGTVNVQDLLDMLTAWGPNPGHPADLNGDGAVNVVDLLCMLAAWGAC